MVEELVAERRPDAGERENILLNLGKVLDEFRSVSPNMPVSQIMAFLMVALDVGLGMSEVSDVIRVKNSTASRYLLELGPERLPGDGALGLIERGVDPQNTRKARYSLSRKGKRLIDDVVAELTNKG
jgi:DNA-binding MarR family transcriptional regulator